MTVMRLLNSLQSEAASESLRQTATGNPFFNLNELNVVICSKLNLFQIIYNV